MKASLGVLLTSEVTILLTVLSSALEWRNTSRGAGPALATTLAVLANSACGARGR